MAVEMFFMTKSPRKNVPDVGIELGAACMPSGHASNRATAPGSYERGLQFTAGGISFQQLIRNVVYHPRFILFLRNHINA